MAKHPTHGDHSFEVGMFPVDEVTVVESSTAMRPDNTSQTASTSHSVIYNPFYTGTPRTPPPGSRPPPIDRQEIIRRIKSGGSRPTSPELERPGSRSSVEKRRSPVLGFKPGPQASDAHQEAVDVSQSTESAGLEIERPRSALHRGDFRQREQEAGHLEDRSKPKLDDVPASLSTSPVAPWHPDFPSAAFRRPFPYTPSTVPTPRTARPRTVSNVSLASGFVYKSPTSPLVQASRPDTPEPGQSRRTPSPDKSRRHTFSPQSFQQLRASADTSLTEPQDRRRHSPARRSETTLPYQAHQPRRSMHSVGLVSSDLPNGARRPSLSESPLHLAPMVGSYEESILRGRMSTTPSKPLNFVAQIGVLGKGACKTSLRCPPHVTVPFPAVFYSYGSAVKGPTGDQPSPYVGLVDLENGLPAPETQPEKRRQRRHARAGQDETKNGQAGGVESHSSSDAQTRSRKLRKQKRRSGSPRAPPGGSYRIPQQGQIQVVIKNPNKTAVKLFLVPYDLSDMEPGQKTFVRQRSYAAGPIIDMPLTARRNLGTDRPEAALGATADPNDKPMLRYLVHLHICCPAKGRFFLYKSIRVVFANRVPDGKERLRNEIQLPDPRYSVYKRGRDSNVGISSSSNTITRDPGRPSEDAPPAEPPQYRQPAPPGPSPLDSHWSQHSRRFLAQSLPAAESNPDFNMPMQPLRLYAAPPRLPPLESRPGSRQTSDGPDAVSPQRTASSSSTIKPFASPNSAAAEHFGGGGDGDDVFQGSKERFAELNRPFSFVRERNGDQSSATAVRGESLLSRRLKDLAVQTQGSAFTTACDRNEDRSRDPL